MLREAAQEGDSCCCCSFTALRWLLLAVVAAKSIKALMKWGPPLQLHAPSLFLLPAASEIIILALRLREKEKQGDKKTRFGGYDGLRVFAKRRSNTQVVKIFELLPNPYIEVS